MSRKVVSIACAVDTTEFWKPRVAQLREGLADTVEPRKALERYLTTERRPEDQGLVDLIVAALLRGEDVRAVLTIWNKRGIKPNDAREVAAVSEVARLTHELHDRVEAIYKVAEVFHVAVRTVERWCEDHDDKAVDVLRYISDLKAARLLR